MIFSYCNNVGLLNGVDLHNLSRDAVYLETDQVIEGTYIFENAVALTDIEVKGTVNGLDLKVFDKNVTNFLEETNHSISLMGEYANDQCRIAKYLQESLKSKFVYFSVIKLRLKNFFIALPMLRFFFENSSKN